MYQVFRKRRKQFGGKAFSSFEAARQAVRRYIRKTIEKTSYADGHYGHWDSISRSPTSYTTLGFTIRKVA